MFLQRNDKYQYFLVNKNSLSGAMHLLQFCNPPENHLTILLQNNSLSFIVLLFFFASKTRSSNPLQNKTNQTKTKTETIENCLSKAYRKM